MTEEQKYQGSLYKNKNKKAKTTHTVTEPNAPAMAQPAYIEDVPDEYEGWKAYEVDSDDDNESAAEPPPEAPTPPSADEGHVNVFDFLVANATPSASNISLPRAAPVQLSEDTQLVRFEYESNGYLDQLGQVMDEDAMIQYGTGPVPSSNFETPAPKAERKKSKESERDPKKDKKRKRLHLDIHDQVMTDAPPVLHSGLTGGLNKLMSRPSVFPPSPDYSGGDVAETPASPLKKTRHSKHRKSSRIDTGIGNSIMAMISSGSSKTKTKKRKQTSSSSAKKHERHHHHSHSHRLEAPKEQKLLEYKPSKDKDDKDKKEEDHHAMVLYKPRAEHFLSFINKGPDSDRGCSMNKALKRYHRERSTTGNNTLSKPMEEKELWRSLRLKKNDRGEIVLFSV